ncbi:MAG: hypothetical protein R3E95_09850 [Thiolinea sp.]
MADHSHLQQQLKQLQQRWQTLHEKQELLQNQYDRETRSEERFRLQPLLNDNSDGLGAVEAEIQVLQGQIKQAEVQKLRSELITLRRNKAYPQALEVARQIATLLPGDLQALREADELQQQLENGKQAQQVFVQLATRYAELQPVMKDLALVLNPRNEHELLDTVTAIAGNFLDGHLQASDFIQIFQDLFSGQMPHTDTDPHHQYARIAASICQGRTVLFLGSAIPGLYSGDGSDEYTLARRLADDIRYPDFSGSLSAIAEYYQLTPGFGRSSLLDSLHKSLPHALPDLNLYQSLARITEHLVIISAAYDTLLEDAFRAQGKPFVEIASIIMPSDDYKLGTVVLNYSDREQACTLRHEELSPLELLQATRSFTKVL